MKLLIPPKKYLKKKNFNRNVMTVDFNKAAYKAFKLNFQNTCFFHLFQRLNLKFPQLKDKNKTFKTIMYLV